MDLPLQHLPVFVKVVQSRGFTAAGRDLGLPRSTVSRRIAELEQHLGVRLLRRTTRRLSLTDAGETFYERCVRSLGDLEEAEHAVRAVQATPQGLLRVTTVVDVGDVLAEVVAGFVAEHPAVTVELELTERVVDLVAEGFDLALRGGTLPSSSLVAKRVTGDTRRLYASPDYLRARGVPANLEELAQHEHIVSPPDRASLRWRLTDGRRNVEVPLRARILVNQFGFGRAAAVHGAGIILMPWFVGAADVEAGRLVRVLPELQSPAAWLHVVYPSRRQLTAATRAFRDRLLERLAACPTQA